MSELIPNKIRCFAVPVPTGPGVRAHDVYAVACDEEGMQLSQHYCSNVAFAQGDILGQHHHNQYIARYPDGYVCEWIDQIPEDWKTNYPMRVPNAEGNTIQPFPKFDASMIIIDQGFVDKVLQRAEKSQFGLDFDEDEREKNTNIEMYAQHNLQSLAMLLVGKCHAKYNLISVFQAALEELAEALLNRRAN